MSNSSHADLSATLYLVSIQFNRYLSILIFLFGTVGNLLNCLVLSRPPLRSNPCIFYFLVSSIANMISISVGLSTRILSGWSLDPTTTNAVACKARAFSMFVSRSVAFWLIALATVDRWLSSSSHYQRRQLSTLHNAQQGTAAVIVVSSLLYAQVLYCYNTNVLSAPLRCYGKTITCRLITDLTYATVTILCPLLIMALFGTLTISNVRQRYSMSPSQKQLIGLKELHGKKGLRSTRSRRRIDRYLRHVLFTQIVFLAVLTVPQAIEKFYTTLTIHLMKSALYVSVHTFIYNIALLLAYLASGMPFYIYTLSGGSVFRNALMDVFRINK